MKNKKGIGKLIFSESPLNKKSETKFSVSSLESTTNLKLVGLITPRKKDSESEIAMVSPRYKAIKTRVAQIDKQLNVFDQIATSFATIGIPTNSHLQGIR